MPNPACRDRQEHRWGPGCCQEGSGNPGRLRCRAWLQGRDREGGSRAAEPREFPASRPYPGSQHGSVPPQCLAMTDPADGPLLGFSRVGASGMDFRCRGRGTRTPRLGPPPQGRRLVAPWAGLLCSPHRNVMPPPAPSSCQSRAGPVTEPWPCRARGLAAGVSTSRSPPWAPPFVYLHLPRLRCGRPAWGSQGCRGGSGCGTRAGCRLPAAAPFAPRQGEPSTKPFLA